MTTNEDSNLTENLTTDPMDEEESNRIPNTTVDNDEERMVQRDNDEIVQDERMLINKIQFTCSVISHMVSLISIVLVSVWVSQLGGLSSSLSVTGQAKLVFNWHPLLMIAAFFFMTVASLSFRSSVTFNNSWNRSTKKCMHGVAWLIAALCGTIGLVAVFRSHNDQTSGYIANLYSLHSWMGMLVVVFYVVQFLVAFFIFGGVSAVTTTMKRQILMMHKLVGPAIYVSTAVTILLGIQEKEGFVGCSYKVDQADTFPIQHFGEIPSVCKTSHSLGLAVLLVALTTSIALYDFNPSNNNNNRRRE